MQPVMAKIGELLACSITVSTHSPIHCAMSQWHTKVY